MPEPLRPMLATRGTALPSGADWTHEVKWDGMRILARVDAAGVRLTSRHGNDATASFPELQGLAAAVDVPVLLDGEVVALPAGRPDFSALASRMHVSRAGRADELARGNPVSYLLFDLLAADGVDLTGRALAERRRALEALGLHGPNWATPPGYPDGRSLLEATRVQGLEGVVSKRWDSVYLPGTRSPHWLKFPHRDTSSWVIGGWRFQTDSTTTLGALLIGEPAQGGLLYRGRVGSGLTGTMAGALGTVLEGLVQRACPFVDEVPAADARGVRWVDPVLVVDVEALGMLPTGRLRQPTFRGVRTDLTPQDLE